jgi:hypothetical protein
MVGIVLSAEIVFHNAAKDPDFSYWLIAFLAVIEVGVCLYFHFKLRGCYQILRLDAANRTAIGERQKWHIMLFAFSFSMVLYGFGLRALGFPLVYCVPFYATGIIMHLSSTPRKLD